MDEKALDENWAHELKLYRSMGGAHLWSIVHFSYRIKLQRFCDQIILPSKTWKNKNATNFNTRLHAILINWHTAKNSIFGAYTKNNFWLRYPKNNSTQKKKNIRKKKFTISKAKIIITSINFEKISLYIMQIVICR